jgi:hypothetical protein
MLRPYGLIVAGRRNPAGRSGVPRSGEAEYETDVRGVHQKIILPGG